MPTPVMFTVPPANRGVDYSHTDVDLFSSDLNGIALSGQALSLDLLLASGILANLTNFSGFPLEACVLFVGQTGSSGNPGGAGITSGRALDAGGSPTGPTDLEVGWCTANDGRFAAGVFFSFNLTLGGIRLDIVFPDAPGRVITNAQLRFSCAAGEAHFQFN